MRCSEEVNLFTLNTEILIHRAVAEVFAFVADQTNTPRWQTGLVEVRRITPGPIGVGTEHVFVRSMLGRRDESRTRYVDYEPDRLVAFEVDDGTVSGRVTYRFGAAEPEDASASVGPAAVPSTLVTCEMQFSLHGIARIAEPFLRRQIQRESRNDDRRLARVLES